MRNFREDLTEGEAGERRFCERYRGWQRDTKGYQTSHDIKIELTMELKSERYTTKQSPNFAIERFSNFETQSEGGPWKVGLNADYYAHQFLDEQFVFSTKEFRKRCDEIQAKHFEFCEDNDIDTMSKSPFLRTAVIKNQGFETLVLLINRIHFLDLRLEEIEIQGKTLFKKHG